MRTQSAPEQRHTVSDPPPEAAGPRSRDHGAAPGRVLTRSSLVLLPLLGLALVIGAWWGYVVAFDVPQILLPAPPDVVRALIDSFPTLMEHARVTLTQSAIGFSIAVVGGTAIGTAIAGSRIAERMAYPWLVAFDAIPKVALAPLLVAWMGFGMQPRITMVVLICFFPIVIATVTGLSNTPSELVDLARSLDASRLQTFLKIRFRHALPQMFIGLKVALPLAIIGSVVGEFAGGRTGMGFVIQQASTNKPLAFAAILVLSAMSVTLFYSLVAAERALLPWVRATSTR